MVSKKLIVCEGPDDKGLITRFLIEYLNFSKNDFQIEVMNGKSFLLDESNERYQRIKQMFDTGQYSRILFVLDADYEENDAMFGGFDNSETQVKNLITKLGLSDVADYFISCDPVTKEGNLEHLLLSAAEPSKRNCIESFISCIQGMQTDGNKKIVYSSYNVIFKEHPYNFDHSNFDALKQKMSWLFS